jgi:hypothetical protein
MWRKAATSGHARWCCKTPSRQEVALSSFAAAVDRNKGNLAQVVPNSLVDRAESLVGLTHRDRVLTPAVTTRLALHRCLHPGTAISHLRRFAPVCMLFERS